MSRVITLVRAEGSSRIEEADFPISVGGPGSGIEVPGATGDAPAAWLGLSGGDLYVQAGEGVERVSCNGNPVSASQWLHAGDRVGIGDLQIRVAEDDEGFRILVGGAAIPASPDLSAGQVVKPIAPISAGSEPITVRPAEFRPRSRQSAAGRRESRRTGWVAVLVVLALGIGTAAAWLLLSARWIELEISPDPDSVSFEADLSGIQLGGRWLIRPGTYRLEAEKVGYAPLQAEVTVGGDPEQTFSFTMERLPGYLLIDVGGSEGIRVIIDDEPAGSTPLEPVELPAGAHEVRLEADRFLALTRQVSIEGGGATQRLEVELLPGWAEIGLSSEPAGATVRIGRRVVGRTPLKLELGAGSYEVTFALDGHVDVQRTVRVEAGRARTLPMARLQLQPAHLQLSSDPEGASVTLNRTFEGLTPLEIELTPGRDHEIRLTKAGYDSVSREVRMDPGETLELALALGAIEATVEIQLSPPDAVIYVEGRAVATEGGVLRLPAAPQTLEVKKEGYVTYRTTVTPRPGIPQQLRISLKADVPPEPAKRLATSQGHELILVQGGRFRMGASRREPGRRANEALREVELTRPFYVSASEISNREFLEFHSAHRSGSVGPYSLEGDDQPVVRVTWQEAARFCNWLSARESLPPAYTEAGEGVKPVVPLSTGYRLPTEAEWAFVARASGGSELFKYPWGSSFPVPDGAGNYADKSAQGLLARILKDYDDEFAATSPVASFSPNGLGMYNMGGNVAEWVHDIYAIRGGSTDGVERDPTGAGEGELHVIRGSGWMDSTISELRFSYRDYGKDPRPDVGFRIARYLE